MDKWGQKPKTWIENVSRELDQRMKKLIYFLNFLFATIEGTSRKSTKEYQHYKRKLQIQKVTFKSND